MDIQKAHPTLEEAVGNSIAQNDYTKILKFKYEHNSILSEPNSSMLLKKAKTF